jgi:hypothetical protein
MGRVLELGLAPERADILPNISILEDQEKMAPHDQMTCVNDESH